MRCALLVIALLLVAGCGKGCARDADAPAAPSIDAPAPPLPPDASPDERAAHYQAEVARLSRDLAGAEAGLKVARTDADAAELRAWRTWTRWIGLAGCALAVLLGGLLSWLVSPRVGVPLAVIVAAAALAVLTFGSVLRWLPLILGGLVVVGLCGWALWHHRTRAALAYTARLGDAIETGVDVGAAKLLAREAQVRAGVHRLVQRVRGKVRGSGQDHA